MFFPACHFCLSFGSCASLLIQKTSYHTQGRAQIGMIERLGTQRLGTQWLLLLVVVVVLVLVLMLVPLRIVWLWLCLLQVRRGTIVVVLLIALVEGAIRMGRVILMVLVLWWVVLARRWPRMVWWLLPHVRRLMRQSGMLVLVRRSRWVLSSCHVWVGRRM